MRSCRPTFSDEQKAAMRLVETLIEEGQVVLGPDRWVRGALRFQRPSVVEVETTQGDARQLQIATIIPAPKASPAGCHTTQGTRVLLSDGSELMGVQSITLRADVNSVWVATIEVAPQVVPALTADANVHVIETTDIADESRTYAPVVAD